MRTSLWAIAAGCACLLAGTARAQDAAPVPSVYTDVIGCRAIVDPAQRLVCFDERVARLEASRDADELTIISREEVRRTRRGLFGLDLGNFRLFGKNDDAEEAVREITASLVSASTTVRGTYVLHLDDGSVWDQTDTIYIRRPVAGDTVVVRRAVLGSYMARVNDGLSMRVRRRR